MPYTVQVRQRGQENYALDTTYADDQAHLAEGRAQAWRDQGQEARTLAPEPTPPAPEPPVAAMATPSLLRRIEAEIGPLPDAAGHGPVQGL